MELSRAGTSVPRAAVAKPSHVVRKRPRTGIRLTHPADRSECPLPGLCKTQPRQSGVIRPRYDGGPRRSAAASSDARRTEARWGVPRHGLQMHWNARSRPFSRLRMQTRYAWRRPRCSPCWASPSNRPLWRSGKTATGRRGRGIASCAASRRPRSTAAGGGPWSPRTMRLPC
jgi:hypothetical protein